MPATSGIVKQVFIKEYDSPKSFEFEGKTITNTHRCSIKMEDDTWYGLGDVNNGVRGEVFVKAGLITAGADIEFMFTQSPCKKFNNIKKATICINKAGAPNEHSESKIPQPSANQAVGSPNPAAVGQAMNLAVELGVCKSYADMASPDKVREAIIAYKAAKLLFSDLWEPATKEPQPKVRENETQAAGFNDSFDDDIPF